MASKFKLAAIPAFCSLWLIASCTDVFAQTAFAPADVTPSLLPNNVAKMPAISGQEKITALQEQNFELRLENERLKMQLEFMREKFELEKQIAELELRNRQLEEKVHGNISALADPRNNAKVLRSQNSSADEKSAPSTKSTIQLPPLDYTTLSTTVHVPDGGKVLLSGKLLLRDSLGSTDEKPLVSVTPSVTIMEEEEALVIEPLTKNGDSGAAVENDKD